MYYDVFIYYDRQIIEIIYIDPSVPYNVYFIAYFAKSIDTNWSVFANENILISLVCLITKRIWIIFYFECNMYVYIIIITRVQWY